MNLLFSWADVPLWSWIVSAVIIVIAIVIIVLIILWARKKSAQNSGKSSKKSTEEKPASTATASSTAKTEEKPQPAKQEATQKPAEIPAPAATAKSEPAPAKDNGKVYHISKRKNDGKWQIKLEGGAKAIKLFDTQAEAIAYGKTLSDNQDARVVLHKLDGSFRKLTY